jgi:glucokinase
MRENVLAGIDLGGTFIKYGLVDSDGKILVKSSTPTPGGRQAILKGFAVIVAELRDIASAQRRTLQAIGVGSPGIVDSEKGKIIGRSPNLPGWQGAEVKKKLESTTGLPVAVDNDANVMALAEHRFGSPNVNSGMYITVGTGIGSGIIIDNRLWRGARFAGAELGHTIIEKNGKQCKCGKRGCLELYANAEAFRSYYGKKIPPAGGVRYIFEQAKAGDQQALRAIETAADYLACGIGSALELLNPEVVVIGGGVAAGGEPYFRAIRSRLKSYASSSSLAGLRVLKARLGNDAGLIGAALLAKDK